MNTNKRISPEGQARQRRIAARILEGKSLAAIAREEGVARQTIWKQAAADDVRQIVVAAVNAELGQILLSFGRALQVISDAFDARVVRVGKDGKPVVLGPDHYARLAAVDSLLKIMTAGRPVPKAVADRTERRTKTLAEVEAELGIGVE